MRLLVSRTAARELSEYSFAALADLLLPGDLVVVNPSDALKQGARVNARPAPAGQQGGITEPGAGGKSGNQGEQDQ